MNGVPVATPQVFHLAYTAPLLIMWLAARSGPLSLAVLPRQRLD